MQCGCTRVYFCGCPLSVLCLCCRYDVLLTANASVGNYWITVQPQYRLGSPNGFGILRYEGAPPTLPQGPTPQPGTVKPWTLSQIDQVSSSALRFNAAEAAPRLSASCSIKLSVACCCATDANSAYMVESSMLPCLHAECDIYGELCCYWRHCRYVFAAQPMILCTKSESLY